MQTTRKNFFASPVLFLIALLILFGALISCSSTGLNENGTREIDRPNVLIILADDLGYSDVGAFGGEIETPHLDRLAENGLRYTQFYNDGRCWPTRASLLTGYYAQQVRIDPRRGDQMPEWAGMLPDYFKPLGYRAYHSGKWHIHLERKPIKYGHFDRSYFIRDFDRFFAPKRHFLNGEKLPAVQPQEDFYLTTEIADRTIQFLREHQKKHDDRPWLSYMAFTAPHFPLHAPQEDIQAYDGTYDSGWDRIRKKRLKRMKELGIVDETVSLPSREPDVVPDWNLWSKPLKDVLGPLEERSGHAWSGKTLTSVYGPGEVGRAVAWSSLTEEQKTFQAKKMQVHAAMIDRMDDEIGRVLRQIKKMGDRKNTVVLFLSDNGASAELLVRGDGHDRSAPMGSGDSYLCLGPGWSTASNTPYRLHKHWTHEGGIRTPFILNWPAGLPDSAEGELRRTPAHVIDLLPTLLDLAGEPSEQTAKNAPPLPGKSLVPTFEQDVQIKRSHLFFNHSGNRALRNDGWMGVQRERRDAWELYHMDRDPNERKDLADDHPERLRRMKQRWNALNNRYRLQSRTRSE